MLLLRGELAVNMPVWSSRQHYALWRIPRQLVLLLLHVAGLEAALKLPCPQPEPLTSSPLENQTCAHTCAG